LLLDFFVHDPNPKLYWPYDPDSKNNTSCIRMPSGIDDLSSQDYVTILGIYSPSYCSGSPGVKKSDISTTLVAY